MKSSRMKLAHTITKYIIRSGDNYRATFGEVLKMLHSNENTLLLPAPRNNNELQEIVATSPYKDEVLAAHKEYMKRFHPDVYRGKASREAVMRQVQAVNQLKDLRLQFNNFEER